MQSAGVNLSELGLASGFDFLGRATGWAYSFSLIERSIDDTHGRTLMIGVMNTVFLGVITIFLSTDLGFAIGAARIARNLSVAAAAAVFVQIFRNIPLILQLVFWSLRPFCRCCCAAPPHWRAKGGSRPGWRRFPQPLYRQHLPPVPRQHRCLTPPR